MRATNDLIRLEAAINQRLRRLRRLSSGYKATPLTKPLMSSVAIELDNLVLSGIRAFLISSLTGTRTVNRRRVTTSPSFHDEGQVGAFTLSILSNYAYTSTLSSPARVNRRQEFRLRDPRLLERVMASCSASNLLSVQYANSLRTTLFGQLPTVRNFYAHRNDDTWRKVKRAANDMGIFGVNHTDELLSARIPGRTVTVIEDWMDDAELFFFELLR